MAFTNDDYLPSYEELTVPEIKLSSAVLRAGAIPFGKYCDDVCKVIFALVHEKTFYLNSYLNSPRIQQKTKAGFSALKCLDNFVQRHRGCSQTVYMRLYKSLVLPVMGYGAAVTVESLAESSKEFGKVQRSAMLKASGCLNSTSTEALEVLTNTMPIDLQLKINTRINVKYEDDPLREEFDEWIEGDKTVGRSATTFHLLMSRFRELKGMLEFENIEQEFRYTKELMGLIKASGSVHKKEFTFSKEEQKENILELLSNCDKNDVLMFTDDSAVGNPGQTGAGAVVYLEGYSSTPVLMNKGVSPIGNNYTGELVHIGIQIGLEFLAALDFKGRVVHILTDCQPAIKTAFITEMPTNKIETVLSIKESLAKVRYRENIVKVHWVPGHNDIEGNELAGQQAKAAASEMITNNEVKPILDKKEAVRECKSQGKEKWERYNCSDKVNVLQEIFEEVGKRICHGDRDRRTFSAVNQLLCGHSILNDRQAKLNKDMSSLYETCNMKEIVDHFLFHCQRFKSERDTLEYNVEEILGREDVKLVTDINLKVLTRLKILVCN